MTQQYIVGELSALLGELEPAAEDSLRETAGSLRHQVECSSFSMLPQLAEDALELTDLICGSAQDHGDADAYRRSVTAGTALRDFAVAADLLP